jgi:hypothetical protein
MFAFAVSKTKFDCTFVAAVVPVLQTRAPTGKIFGPTATLLLSSPMTPQVIGVIVSEGAKNPEPAAAFSCGAGAALALKNVSDWRAIVSNTKRAMAR